MTSAETDSVVSRPGSDDEKTADQNAVVPGRFGAPFSRRRRSETRSAGSSVGRQNGFSVASQPRGHAVVNRDHALDRGGARLLGAVDAEHPPGLFRGQLRDAADEIRQRHFVPPDDRFDKGRRVADALAHGRLPGCGRCRSTGQLHDVVANAQARSRDEEVRGMVRGDIGKHVVVCSEPAPRGVVECQQAAVHQGCGRRAQDVGGERRLCGAGLENGAHPDLGGQRQRDAIHRRASRGLRRDIEMIDDGADDGVAAQVTHRHRRLKRSPDDVDEELPCVRTSRVVRGLANGGETTGQRHHRDGRLVGAVLRSRRAGQHDDADQDGKESASANGLTHEQPRGSELIDTGWRSCRLRWNQPRGRYSAPGDRNYKVNSPRGLSLSFAPARAGAVRIGHVVVIPVQVLSIRVAAFALRQCRQ